MRVAVTGLALRVGRLSVATDARGELPVPGIAEVDVDVRPLLRRRKDRKLLPRAAHLAIPAAHEILGGLVPDDVGLFLGVGREPPEDATEAAIVAAERDGRLDPVRLGARGLALYPPLASLRTLPNLVLAHVAIQLGLRGEGGTFTGDGSAGLAAIVEGANAIAEGRCSMVIAGGADSRVHSALVRDQVRRGILLGAGEAAALVRLEPLDTASAPIIAVLTQARAGFSADAPTALEHWQSHGWCGAADGAVAAVLALGEAGSGRLHLVDHASGRATIEWVPPSEDSAP